MKRYLYGFIATTVLLLSCHKDLEITPFELKTDELKIELDTTTFIALSFDSLKITPKLTESKPEGHSFTYSWKVWPNGGNAIQEISQERNLKIKVLLAPQLYRIQFSAKDEVTGIRYFADAFLDVGTSFDEGWLVSHNSEGKGHLGFIRTANHAVYLSPVETVNSKSYSEAEEDIASE